MTTATHPVAAPSAGVSAVPARRVFVIDDDDVMLLSCRRVLEHDGYEVETFDNGQEGIRRLEETRPQLLLVDLKMPEFDGLQVIGRVRAIDPDVVIAVITGYATIATAVDAMKAGAYDFLPKPFTPDELRLVVTRGCERWHLAQESRRLRQEKDAAERRVFTFLSHQLKSPLAAAKQCLDVLTFTAGGGLAPDVAGWIDRARARLDQMVSMIDDWLTLARAERGGGAAGGSSADLAAVVGDVLEAAMPHAAHAAVTLGADVAPGLPPVRGDAVSLATIVSNLVTNAIKYNRRGGQVVVCAVRRGGAARLEVTDTGLGIPAGSLPRIFDEFYRAGGEASGIPGTGLGLAICRRLVHDLGGAIEVTSTEGAGSIFTVTLPLVLREPQDDPEPGRRVAPGGPQDDQPGGGDPS
jgi:two-component system, sensor histidine kinase and response regulator